MKGWHVVKVDCTIENGRLSITERVLTFSSTRAEATASLRRMRNIGIENLHLAKPNPKKYRMLLRQQRKRRGAARKLSSQEISKIIDDSSS